MICSMLLCLLSLQPANDGRKVHRDEVKVVKFDERDISQFFGTYQDGLCWWQSDEKTRVFIHGTETRWKLLPKAPMELFVVWEQSGGGGYRILEVHVKPNRGNGK